MRILRWIVYMKSRGPRTEHADIAEGGMQGRQIVITFDTEGVTWQNDLNHLRIESLSYDSKKTKVNSALLTLYGYKNVLSFQWNVTSQTADGCGSTTAMHSHRGLIAVWAKQLALSCQTNEGGADLRHRPSSECCQWDTTATTKVFYSSLVRTNGTFDPFLWSRRRLQWRV